MMGWIDRVVPQPPAPHVTEESPGQEPAPVKAPTGKASGPTDAAEQARTEETEKKVAFEDSSSVFESVGSNVLSWISYGLEKVIPQPAPAPGLQALGKSFETSIDVGDETEVQVLAEEDNNDLDVSAFDAEEDVSEVEAQTGEEEWAGKRVLSWLSHGLERIVPQPEGTKKPESEPKKSEGAVEGTKETKTQAKSKSSTSASQSTPAAKGQPEPVTTLPPQSVAVDSGRMFTWFVQGLEKVMPQPVPREERDTQGGAAATSSPVEQRGKGA